MLTEESYSRAISNFEWWESPVLNIPREKKIELIGQDYLDLQVRYDKLNDELESLNITKETHELMGKVTWEQGHYTVISKMAFLMLIDKAQTICGDNQNEIGLYNKIRSELTILNSKLDDDEIKRVVQDRINNYISSCAAVDEILRLKGELSETSQKVYKLEEELKEARKQVSDKALTRALSDYF